MKNRQNLTEHYVTLYDKSDMNEYRDVVWDLLQIAYEGIGGFMGATSPEHLVSKTYLWKMVRRDGKIIAVCVYRKMAESRKSIGVGHDGTRDAKRDIVKVMKDDIRLDRAWVEASGRAEELHLALGGDMLPNIYAAILTGKNIIELSKDGYHYTRLLSGVPIEKVIIGPRSIIDGLK